MAYALSHVLAILYDEIRSLVSEMKQFAHKKGRTLLRNALCANNA
jgi:hypothetical protein